MNAAVMTPAALRHADLAAYTYTRLGGDDPRKTELRADYLSGLARHQAIKQELVPLLAAWHDAGIEALLFKGFYLAEFVYPVPGSRFHGDVDLLLRPEDGPAALAIALRLGWRVPWKPKIPSGNTSHELFALCMPGGATAVDVHRWFIPQSRLVPNAIGRISQAIWEESEGRAWAGTEVRLPSPVDALLAGLVLNRYVKDGQGKSKSHDAIDFAMLTERYGITKDALKRRAAALGFPRTFAAFMEWFDRANSGLCRAPTSRWPAWPSRMIALAECGFCPTPVLVTRFLKFPGALRDVLKALPIVVRTRGVLRRKRDLREVLRSLTPDEVPSRRSEPLNRLRAVRGIHWAVQLLPVPRGEGRCVLQSLVIYAALRRQGWPVTFVSGVRRTADEFQGHAWITDEDGRVIPELASWGERGWGHYRENFRFPDQGP